MIWTWWLRLPRILRIPKSNLILTSSGTGDYYHNIHHTHFDWYLDKFIATKSVSENRPSQ